MHKFYKKLYEEIGNDKELLRELIEDFITIYQDNIEELSQSIIKVEYKDMSFIAHKLKGSSMNFNMPKFTKAAQQLENIGKNKMETDMETPLNTMKKEFDVFLHARDEL